jgi:integrase
MATLSIDRPITPLRQRMLDDMAVRGLREHTRRDYIRHVCRFAAFLGRSPDTATPDDVRRFQVHQTQSGATASTINSSVSALRFLFTVTLDRPDLARRLMIMRNPRKAPDVLSVDEVARLLQAAPNIKYKAALGVAYGAGLRVSEVTHLKVDDIDSQRMLIRVEQGKGRKDRNAMLSPQLLELLRLWWREDESAPSCCPMAVPRSGLHRSDVDAAAASRRPRGGRGGGHPQAGPSPHVATQLRHAPARAGRRYPRDPGAPGPFEARYDGALHQGRDTNDPCGDQPARPFDGTDGG